MGVKKKFHAKISGKKNRKFPKGKMKVLTLIRIGGKGVFKSVCTVFRLK